MADSKTTALTELNATPETTDVIYIVDDPGGTPVSKKITVANLLAAIAMISDTTPTLGGNLDLNGHVITGIATDADISYTSLAVADLTDTATPSVLTTVETRNKLISNYKTTGADHVFTMCAAHTKGNVIFIIGDEFQVDIEPNGSDYFYLNGTAMAADEHIQNTADTLGQTIVGMCANINGTLRWMFNSGDSDWVEATPPA